MMALSYTLDKPNGYNPGDLITLTVVSDKRLQSQSFPISSAGDNATVSLIIQQGITLMDSTGRKWTSKSDDGKTAVFTATA